MDIEFSEFHTKRQKEKAMAKLLELAKMQRAMTVEEMSKLAYRQYAMSTWGLFGPGCPLCGRRSNGRHISTWP